MSLPTGTVTFLFSDIEGSTQRWETHRAAMQEALRRHDAVLRNAFESHNGYVFKTVGDAFCAVFQSVSSAVEAAIAAQRAISKEDWSAVDGLLVRMAIHTGEADERDGDYFGLAVNRVARLLAIGHGGQVLLSAGTRELAARLLPVNVSLNDLGEQRLRDLTSPEHVYQLIAPGLQSAFAALRSLDALPNNLPLQLTSFVGRDEDIPQIKELLSKTRLLTLVGAGGVGKTRCALQVGADLLDSYPDGVWVAELATISDPLLVVGVVAGALSVQETANRTLLDSIISYLKTRRILLILDNCEHVVQEVAGIANALLHGCSRISIMATSREQLGIAGEIAHRLPSLAVPPEADTHSAERASKYGAVALFAQRAAAADSKFSLTGENAGIVGEICRRLDGIALAIELAAVRVKVLNVKQLADKLHERFRILTGGSRTALPRQQTMRALIDWSYDLLSKVEQSLFRRVAIFAGGWTLEAAGSVCSDDKVAEWEVLDLLTALVDKSMVVVEPGEREQRYRLLESTREYALEKLTECGEYDALARRHAEYVFTFAQRADAAWATTPTRVWDPMVSSELDNIRAAFVWALEERNDVQLAQRLAGTLQWCWRLQPTEGRRWARGALETCDSTTSADVVARLWLIEAMIASTVLQHKIAYDALMKSLSFYEHLGDRKRVAEIQVRLARAGSMLHGMSSELNSGLTKALATARESGEKRLVGFALEMIATLQHDDNESSRRLFAEARTIARTTGDEWSAVRIATNLAELEFRAGNTEEAIRVAEEGIALRRSLNDLRFLFVPALNLAAYLISLGRYDDARRPAQEALALARDAQAEIDVAFAIQHLGSVAAGLGHYERSARLMGFCDFRLTQLDGVREKTEQMEYIKIMSVLREHLGLPQVNKLMDEGRVWDEDQAIAEALLV